MHLRDGKVLAAPPSTSHKMPELAEALDPSKRGNKGPPRGQLNPPPVIDLRDDPDPRDALLIRMSEQLQQLQDKVDQLESSRPSPPQLNTPMRSLDFEYGPEMSSFLANYEIECLEADLPTTMWGTKMRCYLKGEALNYYLYLRRIGTDFRQWEPIRENFLHRFCKDTRDSVLTQLGRNTWRGDHALYTTRFAQAVARGVVFPPDELAKLFVANLPPALQRTLTDNGTKCYKTWEEAAVALSKLEQPWSVMQAEYRRIQQGIQDAMSREAAKQARRPTAGPGQHMSTDFRCGECQGIGHRDVNCPLKQPGHVPKKGFTCNRCGGKDHFLAECATKPFRSPPRGPPPNVPNVPSYPTTAQPAQSNGVA